MAWINSMMALVSSDELAKDVTGAEALLERHQVCLLKAIYQYLKFTSEQFHFQVILVTGDGYGHNILIVSGNSPFVVCSFEFLK